MEGAEVLVQQQADFYYWTALLIAIPAILSPMFGAYILHWLISRVRSEERAEDIQRQDDVATRVEQARTDLQEVSKKTNGKLDKIETLVDGQFTLRMQETLDAKRGLLIALREIIALRGEGQASEAAALEVVNLQKDVDDLQKQISERREAQVTAALQSGGHGND